MKLDLMNMDGPELAQFCVSTKIFHSKGIKIRFIIDIDSSRLDLDIITLLYKLFYINFEF